MKRIDRLVYAVIGFLPIYLSCNSPTPLLLSQTDSSANCWTGAGENQIPVDSFGIEIRYGRNLIAHTAQYLGPKGSVAAITNGMNCQNCHLDAGTKPWGNNYGSVASTYPRFRDRSGTIESIEKRINDCLQRSLHGKAIDSTSREMRAMVAYIQWLGAEVPKGKKVKGSGIQQLPYLQRAADPLSGEKIYVTQCARCHGKQGEGQPDANGIEYTYPPLWGIHSYTTGAGLYRLSRLAGYIRNNMPNPVNYHQPLLTDTEAWDVAAFINSQPRPDFDISSDWPDIKAKPVDHPFGPFADTFRERQHKFGPWVVMGKGK
jgi:thiosulfate dehydrogenase